MNLAPGQQRKFAAQLNFHVRDLWRDVASIWLVE